MARRKCRGCGQMISESAFSCPHCLHTTNLGRWSKRILWALIILFVLFLVTQVWGGDFGETLK